MWLLRVLVVLLLATVLLGAVACVNRVEWAAWGIVSAPNRGVEIDFAKDADAAELTRRGVTQAFRVPVGPPAASLAVWVIEPATNPRGTILFLHGIRDRKESLLGLAKAQSQRGYRSVLVDARGHGRSSGDYLSYGVWETQDYRQVLDDLERRGLLAGPVGVYGMSYGAACAIQLAGGDQRIAAVVAVAPFSSLRSAVYGYAHMLLPFAPCPAGGWLDQAIERAGQIAAFDPTQADVITAAQSTHAQLLLIHGREDAKISWHEFERLHTAAPANSELIVVDNEGHDSITLDRSGSVFKNASEWFDRWLTP